VKAEACLGVVKFVKFVKRREEAKKKKKKKNDGAARTNQKSVRDQILIL